jgi:hypothetical protein
MKEIREKNFFNNEKILEKELKIIGSKEKENILERGYKKYKKLNERQKTILKEYILRYEKELKRKKVDLKKRIESEYRKYEEEMAGKTGKKLLEVYKHMENNVVLGKLKRTGSSMEEAREIMGADMEEKKRKKETIGELIEAMMSEELLATLESIEQKEWLDEEFRIKMPEKIKKTAEKIKEMYQEELKGAYKEMCVGISQEIEEEEEEKEEERIEEQGGMTESVDIVSKSGKKERVKVEETKVGDKYIAGESGYTRIEKESKKKDVRSIRKGKGVIRERIEKVVERWRMHVIVLMLILPGVVELYPHFYNNWVRLVKEPYRLYIKWYHGSDKLIEKLYEVMDPTLLAGNIVYLIGAYGILYTVYNYKKKGGIKIKDVKPLIIILLTSTVVDIYSELQNKIERSRRVGKWREYVREVSTLVDKYRFGTEWEKRRRRGDDEDKRAWIREPNARMDPVMEGKPTLNDYVVESWYVYPRAKEAKVTKEWKDEVEWRQRSWGNSARNYKHQLRGPWIEERGQRRISNLGEKYSELKNRLKRKVKSILKSVEREGTLQLPGNVKNWKEHELTVEEKYRSTQKMRFYYEKLSGERKEIERQKTERQYMYYADYNYLGEYKGNSLKRLEELENADKIISPYYRKVVWLIQKYILKNPEKINEVRGWYDISRNHIPYFPWTGKLRRVWQKEVAPQKFNGVRNRKYDYLLPANVTYPYIEEVKKVDREHLELVTKRRRNKSWNQNREKKKIIKRDKEIRILPRDIWVEYSTKLPERQTRTQALKALMWKILNYKRWIDGQERRAVLHEIRYKLKYEIREALLSAAKREKYYQKQPEKRKRFSYSSIKREYWWNSRIEYGPNLYKGKVIRKRKSIRRVVGEKENRTRTRIRERKNVIFELEEKKGKYEQRMAEIEKELRVKSKKERRELRQIIKWVGAEMKYHRERTIEEKDKTYLEYRNKISEETDDKGLEELYINARTREEANYSEIKGHKYIKRMNKVARLKKEDQHIREIWDMVEGGRGRMRRRKMFKEEFILADKEDLENEGTALVFNAFQEEIEEAVAGEGRYKLTEIAKAWPRKAAPHYKLRRKVVAEAKTFTGRDIVDKSNEIIETARRAKWARKIKADRDRRKYRLKQKKRNREEEKEVIRVHELYETVKNKNIKEDTSEWSGSIVNEGPGSLKNIKTTRKKTKESGRINKKLGGSIKEKLKESQISKIEEKPKKMKIPSALEFRLAETRKRRELKKKAEAEELEKNRKKPKLKEIREQEKGHIRQRDRIKKKIENLEEIRKDKRLETKMWSDKRVSIKNEWKKLKERSLKEEVKEVTSEHWKKEEKEKRIKMYRKYRETWRAEDLVNLRKIWKSIKERKTKVKNWKRPNQLSAKIERECVNETKETKVDMLRNGNMYNWRKDYMMMGSYGYKAGPVIRKTKGKLMDMSGKDILERKWKNLPGRVRAKRDEEGIIKIKEKRRNHVENIEDILKVKSRGGKIRLRGGREKRKKIPEIAKRTYNEERIRDIIRNPLKRERYLSKEYCVKEKKTKMETQPKTMVAKEAGWSPNGLEQNQTKFKEREGQINRKYSKKKIESYYYNNRIPGEYYTIGRDYWMPSKLYIEDVITDADKIDREIILFEIYRYLILKHEWAIQVLVINVLNGMDIGIITMMVY